MTEPFRLTPAHHLIINGMGFVTAKIMRDDRLDMVLRELGAVAETAPRGHPLMDRLCDLALTLARLGGRQGNDDFGSRWGMACMEASGVMADVFIWRMAAAQGAMNRPEPVSNPQPKDAAHV